MSPIPQIVHLYDDFVWPCGYLWSKCPHMGKDKERAIKQIRAYKCKPYGHQIFFKMKTKWP